MESINVIIDDYSIDIGVEDDNDEVPFYTTPNSPSCQNVLEVSSSIIEETSSSDTSNG